jgi:GNAT superfamily N-acetyltransferase
MHLSWSNGEYEVSTDPARIDVDLVHDFLAGSYWAKGIPRETVRRSIEGALCFGVYQDRQQVGFARTITDRATFCYLGDVFIVEAHRARGLSKWLLQCILGHPDLQGLRRWILATKDAHGLYEQLGYRTLANPDRWMEIHDPAVYQRGGGRDPR